MSIYETFTQTLEVQNDLGNWIPMPYERVTVVETARNPVREMQFTVAGLDRSSDEWSLLTLARWVRLVQVVDGITYTFIGRIADRPKQLKAPASDIFEVTVYDESHDATRYIFVDSWPQGAITTWSEIVEDAWTRHGPSGITFTGVNTHTGEPALILNPLLSLFDFMENIAARTGWVWRVVDGDLQFYDPITTIVGPDIVDEDIVPDSVLSEDFPEVANVVKIPALFTVDDFEDNHTTEAGRAQYLLQYPPRTGHGVVEEYFKPEIWLNAVQIDPGDVALDGEPGSDLADVVYNLDNRFIRFNPGHIPVGGLSLVIIYDAEIPVLIEVEHASSIELYGRIDHVIRRSPRPSREEAEEIAEAYLETHALPITGFQARLLEHDVRAGRMQRVILADHNINQLMPVTQIRRTWTRQNGLEVWANFDRAPVQDDDLIMDLFRRLNKLEARETARQDRIERYLSVDDTWQWSDEIELGWSDVNWLADTHDLKHLSQYIVDGGRLIYPS